MTSLLCDLGGTNCRFGLVNQGSLISGSQLSYTNDQFADFHNMLDCYRQAVSAENISSVVIALAAPVEGQSIKLTNREWIVDRVRIGEITGSATVDFINDFEALGYSIVEPDRLETVELYKPQSGRINGTKLVLGAGTGFNCAITTIQGEVVCAEAGHTTFAAETELDVHYQNHFVERYGRCSTERLVSGSGLLAIYQLLCSRDDHPSQLPDSHQVAVEGLNGTDPFAHRACHEFCRLLGKITGDLALVSLPYGGIFLTGGVTRALRKLLVDPEGEFLRSFQAKGRMAEQMKEFPISLILDDNAALFGCMQRAAQD